MPTLNYTTTVAASKTVAEIQTLLAKQGADAIATRYAEGRAVGVSFQLTTPHGQRHFVLPIDVNAMGELLKKQWRNRQISPRYATPEQAERVAWRVVKDWLAAQLALVDASMATIDQVMLPYLQVDPEHTLYEAFREREAMALEAASNVRALPMREVEDAAT